LTGTKAKTRVGRARQPRADPEQQLKTCRREIAQAREHLVKALEEQSATSEMLRIISKVSTQPDRQRYINAGASHAKADAFQTRCA
jgi:hypothetical protein